MSRRLLLLLALAFMAPSAAFADDASYCTDLSNLYRRDYSRFGEQGMIPVATAAHAIDQCQKGNYAEGIPPLEKKLRDGRFTLPKRS